MTSSNNPYNAFWPVFIVFFFFTLTAAVQLYSNIVAKSNMQSAVDQLSKGVVQAKAKSDALNGIAHDLIDLAPSSPAAAQIVTDFHIQLKKPATPAPASATK